MNHFYFILPNPTYVATPNPDHMTIPNFTVGNCNPICT